MFVYQEGLIQTSSNNLFFTFISYSHQRILILRLINNSVQYLKLFKDKNWAKFLVKKKYICKISSVILPNTVPLRESFKANSN